MKKTAFLSVLLALAISPFISAQDVFNRSIFIEGSSVYTDHLAYFYENFYNEAVGYGSVIAKRRENAGFVFNFNISDNPNFTADGNLFLLNTNLVNNRNKQEIVSLNFFYNNLEEVYEHTNYLYVKTVSVIPPLSEEGLSFINTAWKYKWIYLRASFDYPVSMYELSRRDDLLGGNALYTPGPGGSKAEPYYNLNNVLFALPGITLGAEFHFLDFMSGDVLVKINAGDPLNEAINEIDFSSVNIGAETRLNFPVKYFNLFVIQPYGAVSFPLLKSKVFVNYPLFFAGGGIQFSTKAGKTGAVFIDVNYMRSFKDAVIKNPYADIAPEPQLIHYKPSYVGIGIGYKHGFINRPRELPNVVFSEQVKEDDPPEDPPYREPKPGNLQIFYF